MQNVALNSLGYAYFNFNILDVYTKQQVHTYTIQKGKYWLFLKN